VNEKGKGKFYVLEKVMDGDKVISENEFKGDKAL